MFVSMAISIPEVGLDQGRGDEEVGLATHRLIGLFLHLAAINLDIGVIVVGGSMRLSRPCHSNRPIHCRLPPDPLSTS